MDLPTLPKQRQTARWEQAKSAYEKKAGKSKPGGWFSNKSGVTEALKSVDDAFGDLQITLRILEKGVTTEMAKQVGTKVATLEKAAKQFNDKAAAYGQVALKSVKAGEGAAGPANKGEKGPHEKADVKELLDALATIGETVGTCVNAFTKLAEDSRKEALKDLKSGGQDDGKNDKALKGLDIFELKMQQHGKTAKDLQRKPDATAYATLALKMVKAFQDMEQAVKGSSATEKSAGFKAMDTRLSKFETESGKVKGGKAGSDDKELAAAVKRMAELTSEMPKLIAGLRKDLGKSAG